MLRIVVNKGRAEHFYSYSMSDNDPRKIRDYREKLSYWDFDAFLTVLKREALSDFLKNNGFKSIPVGFPEEGSYRHEDGVVFKRGQTLLGVGCQRKLTVEYFASLSDMEFLEKASQRSNQPQPSFRGRPS